MKAPWGNGADPANGSDMRKVLYALERSNFIKRLIKNHQTISIKSEAARIYFISLENELLMNV